jgi:exosome complex component RRP4
MLNNQSGHGTFRDDQDQLLSSVCGIVERVNKLISVRPLRARYPGDVGDIVVGRITEIRGKVWKVDIQARQDATLLLSSVNLPGGIQRRKTHEDQLNMRSLFAENDLIVVCCNHLALIFQV